MSKKLILVLALIFACEAFADKRSCAELLVGIPHADTLFDMGEKSVAELNGRIRAVNGALSRSLKFSEEELRALLPRFAHSFDDQMQLKDLFSEPDNAGYYFVTIQAGRLGEWERPIHDFFQSVLAQELPNREEAERRRKEHRRQQPLNPIALHRYENLKAAISKVESKLGQRVMDEDEVKYGARAVYLADHLLEQLAIFDSASISRDCSILEVKRMLRDIARDAESHDHHLVQINEIAAQFCSLNDPALKEELQFYHSKMNQGQLPTSTADLISQRILSWLTGVKDYSHFFGDVLVTAIVEDLQDSLSENPQFGSRGPGGYHSALRTFLAEREQRGLDVFKNEVAAMNWDEARVSFLGVWNLSSIPKVFGKVIDGPQTNLTNVFAVEIPSPSGSRHFAVSVRARVDGNDIELSKIDYRTLQSMEILEIRSTDIPARLQDGFATEPVDLMEPLVELVSSEGTEILKGVNRLLIARVKASESEKLPFSQFEAYLSVGQSIGDMFKGAPRGEYANLRLFHGNEQASSSEMFLPLVGERTGHQIYERQFKINGLSDVNVRLERNLMTQKYTMIVDRRAGVGPLKFSVQKWIGVFAPPRSY